MDMERRHIVEPNQGKIRVSIIRQAQTHTMYISKSSCSTWQQTFTVEPDKFCSHENCVSFTWHEIINGAQWVHIYSTYILYRTFPIFSHGIDCDQNSSTLANCLNRYCLELTIYCNSPVYRTNFQFWTLLDVFYWVSNEPLGLFENTEFFDQS